MVEVVICCCIFAYVLLLSPVVEQECSLICFPLHALVWEQVMEMVGPCLILLFCHFNESQSSVLVVGPSLSLLNGQLVVGCPEVHFL